MQRTAEEVAEVLAGFYSKNFDNNGHEQYRLEWPELRALAGGRKLKADFIAEINEALADNNQVLVAFDTFLALLDEDDCSRLRKLSGRLVEQHLPDEDDRADADDDEALEDD